MTVYVIAESEARFVRACLGANLDPADTDQAVALITEEDVNKLTSRTWQDGDSVLYAGIPDIEVDFFDELRAIGYPA